MLGLGCCYWRGSLVWDFYVDLRRPYLIFCLAMLRWVDGGCKDSYSCEICRMGMILRWCMGL